MKNARSSILLASLLALAGTAFAAGTAPAAHSPLGYPGSGTPGRVIDIGRDTRYINVTQGETVKLNADGQSLAWTFDTLGTPTFTLDAIFPAAGKIPVYVDRDPRYTGGN